MSDRCRKQNNQQTAAVGCGSLILIGLMIFFVGRWSHAPISEEIEALSAQVTELETRVAELKTTLDETRLEVRAAMTVP